MIPESLLQWSYGTWQSDYYSDMPMVRQEIHLIYSQSKY